ncbi:hypothetical protein Rsub_02966 [Raphidocelis subcapitata]|uniref:Uncharacterized protein n=1 Tax=Raphidocelis subcapitata TaxID=307507 RepID=A0A2V0NQ85_9CHLO|nr:hypothetical protein Rsub_02966 [Raphidocelis subcapitata]|eukprot:GBF89796.1 hypothetical protein Rsub_02966 [Raphidocelis subcapitata]
MPLIPSAEVFARYGRWRPPDAAKASAALRAEQAHHDFFGAWSTRLRDLKEFGTGHLLYFHFLRWMAATFAALSLLIAAPQIAINARGAYYAAEQGGLAVSTLGNFGRVSVAHAHDGAAATVVADALFRRERNVTLAFLSDASLPAAWAGTLNKRDAVVAMSALDTIGAAAFFAAALALAFVSRRLCAQADSSTVTIHDYSIRVQRLPQDASAEELVVHVEMVRAYGTLLGLVMRRGAALEALRRAVAQLQQRAEAEPAVDAALEERVGRARAELRTLTQRITDEQAQAASRRTVAAFVTFREEAGKAACLRAQPRSRMRQHALAISDAPEPSDVKYENVEHGAASRAARRALTATLQYASLAVGFALISAASAMRFNQAGILGVDRAACNRRCDYQGSAGVLSLSVPNRELYQACASTTRRPDGGACSAGEAVCYKCYCYEAIGAGMVGEAAYCMGVAGVLVLQYAAQALNVLGILLINMVLVWSSRWLTLFEKHHTRSQEARSLAQKLFLAQFLNSAISTIIANAHLPGLSKLIAGTRGIYTDLTPNWYKTVGVSILTSQLLATALRVATLAANAALLLWRRRAAPRRPTQAALTEALRGPAFELDARYGEHLNVVFVTLLLCGGVPAAYLSAALWFGAAYWTEKWELLRLSRRPVAYGGDLSESVNGLLPFAAVFHFIFSLWAFSFFGTPTSRLLTPGFGRFIAAASARLEPLWRDASGLPPQLAAARLTSATGLHLLAALVVVVGVLFVKLTLTAWLQAGRAALSLLGLIADAQEQELSGAPEFAIALRTQLLVGGSTYAIQAQPEYEAAFGRPDAADGGGGGGGEGEAAAAAAAAAGAQGGPRRDSPRAPPVREPSGSEARGDGGGAGSSGGGGGGSVGGERLSVAQRFRQARRNQVVPLPEEFRPAAASGRNRQVPGQRVRSGSKGSSGGGSSTSTSSSDAGGEQGGGA